MPRKPQRTGESWSLLQVHQEARVTLAIARSVVRQGLIPEQDLTAKDILPMRVAGALLTSPAPDGPRTASAESVRTRNKSAIALLRQWQAGASRSREAYLLITPADAQIAEGAMDLMRLLPALAGDQVLLLPIGAWDEQTRRAVEVVGS